MRDNEIAAIVHREVSQATGYNTDVVAAKHQAALNYYQGIVPAAPAGRSQAVSMDLSDGLHSAMAQICPVVRSSEVSFDAQSQEDETQAQAETDFVKVSIERASGYAVVDQAIHDALLLGNGWVYASVEETKDVSTHKYPAKLTPEEITALKDQAPDGVELSIRAGADYTSVRRTVTTKKLVIECVPPEQMLFSEQGSDFNLATLRFVGRKRLYTAASLVDMGISSKIVDTLPDHYPSTSELARLGDQQNQTNYDAVQDANSLKLVYCCYIRLSLGDDNKTELRKVWVGENGGELLLNEPADYIPYISGSGIPMPHRILGNSFFDLLASVQASKTDILREYLDNLGVLNASRLGVVEGQVEMSDLTSGRINGIVRCRSPNSVWQLPSNDIGQQAINGLNYLDHVIVQRIGSSVDFNDVQAQVMGNSATAAAGQLARVELMAGWFAGNLVRTIMLPLYLLIHRILRSDMAGPVSAKIGGKWQQTDTSTWQPREITSISMGMTSAEKAERLQALSSVLAQQKELLSSGLGGVLTDMSRYYNTASDWVRTSGLENADKYLIDPSSQESKQVQQQNSQQQQKDREDQLAIQEYILKIEQDHKLELQRRDLEFKAYQEEVKLEIEEAKLTSTAVIEVKKLNKSESEEQNDST